MSFFSVLEYKREQSIKHNQRLKDAAKARLRANAANAHKTEPREPAVKNKKAHSKLASRQLDWERMRGDNRHDMKVQIRMDGGGFHRPGSLQI